jgi:hypothetical protein
MAVTHALSLFAKPLFIEDKNPTHSHKLTRNYYAKFYTIHSIILMPHLSSSPNINPIKKY